MDDSKVISDPLYGYIVVNNETIYNLINTKFFQRLRRIQHLGGSSLAYPTANHSRFTHCLGVYELARKIVKLENFKKTSDRNKLLLMVSGLLHDIGHGPYSHAFDRAFGLVHEETGSKIIKNDKEIRKILDKIDLDFAEDVGNILSKKGKFPLLESILSNEVDIDRLDYLRRDAYYTGVPYGNVDLQKLLRSIELHEGRIVFKESSIPALENFLINRFHMYGKVYFHDVSLTYELVLSKIYERILDLHKQKYNFKTNLNILLSVINNKNDFDIYDYLLLDDFYINGMIANLTKEEDEILKTLAEDFLFRRNWDIKPFISEEEYLKDLEKIAKNNKKYFISKVISVNEMYKPEKLKKKNTLIKTSNGEIKKLSRVSKIISSLLENRKQEIVKVVYRKNA